MKKLLLFPSLFLASVVQMIHVAPALADVAFDAFSASTGGTGNLSWTHTVGGTARGVVVFVPFWSTAGGAADEVTTATYGGTAMTEASCSPILLDGTEDTGNHAFFLGASIPTGNQTVAVTTTAVNQNRIGYAVTVTGSADTELVDCEVVNNDNLANPSVTLSLTGRTSFAMLAAGSGVNTIVTDATPLTNWTSRNENDAGTGGMLAYTYDIIGSADVTAGFTVTANRVSMIAVAISEVPAVAKGSTMTTTGAGK